MFLFVKMKLEKIQVKLRILDWAALIDDVLDLSQIEAGEMTLTFEDAVPRNGFI